MNLHSINDMAYYLRETQDEIFVIQREENEFLHVKFLQNESFDYFGKKVKVTHENTFMCDYNAGCKIYILKEVK